MKKRPTDALKREQREIGIYDTARIQVKTLDAIHIIHEMRIMEWRKSKTGYKPSLNDIKNEVYKKGVEAILRTDMPVAGWRTDVFKTTNTTRAEYERLKKKKIEKTDLIVNVGPAEPLQPEQPEKPTTRVYDVEEDEDDGF